MKVIIAFDSYKGSLSSTEACEIASRAFSEAPNPWEVIKLPLCDGGEGMTSCVVNADLATPVGVTVHDPLMNLIDAYYGVSNDGKTAYIEMASACGLELVPLEKRNPTITTTYGLGELILDAIGRGVKNIILGIGGSATCDAGKGMLDALGDTLLPADIRLKVACDVNNPLYGLNGASYIYSPQKGATIQQVEELDQRLRVFAKETERKGLANQEDAFFPGAGAAGGLGYTLKTYLNAELKSGIDLIMEELDFDSYIKDANIVITGEGCSDQQTLMGKVAMGVLRRSRKYNVPVTLMSGCIRNQEDLHAAGFNRIISINEGDERPTAELMKIEVASENMYKTCKLFKQNIDLCQKNIL